VRDELPLLYKIYVDNGRVDVWLGFMRMGGSPRAGPGLRRALVGGGMFVAGLVHLEYSAAGSCAVIRTPRRCVGLRMVAS
jgi:hypothetical protein